MSVVGYLFVENKSVYLSTQIVPGRICKKVSGDLILQMRKLRLREVKINGLKVTSRTSGKANVYTQASNFKAHALKQCIV